MSEEVRARPPSEGSAAGDRPPAEPASRDASTGSSGSGGSGGPGGKVRRRPGRLRRWLVRPLVWILVVVLVLGTAALLYLSSDGFERRIETLVEERASEALGRKVTIEDLDLDLLSLSAGAFDLRIDGPTPEDPPVLTARRVAVDLSLLDLSLWGGSPTVIRLQRLTLQEPRFELIYGEDGASNLPDLPSGGGGGAIEVQLGRLSVEDGVFNYDEQRVPLSLDARGVRGWLEGAAAGGSPYRFRVSARELDTRLPGTAPFAPAISLEGRIFPDRLELTTGSLEAAQLRGDLTGFVRWREPAEVRIEVVARAAAAWANRLGFLEEPVEGSVDFDGLVHWTPEDWHYGGELSSGHLGLLGLRFDQVRGELAGDAGEVRVEVASARHAGGTLEGAFVLDLGDTEAAVDGGRPARIEARAEGLALRGLLDELGLELQGVAGNVSGRLDYRFSTASFWRGDGEGRIRVRGLRRPSDRLELRGEAPVRIDRGVLRVAGARLVTSAQRATSDVTYDLDRRTGAVRYRLDSDDLGELVSIVSPELGSAGEEPPPWWPRGGRGIVAGTLDLTPERVSGHLSFDLGEVAVAAEGLSVERLEGSFDHTPERLSSLEVRAEQSGGELSVSGRVELAGEATTGPEWDLELGAAGWPIASLVPLLPSLPSLEGELSGQLSLAGTFDRPVLAGTLWAEPLRWGDRTVDRAEVELAWAGRAGRVERLVFVGPPGRLTGFGTLDLESGELDLRLEAPELVLDRSQTVAGLAGRLAGTISLDATLGGTLDRPSAHLTLSGRDLALEGHPLGRQGTAELTAEWNEGRVEAHGSLLGLVRFDGGGPLDREGMELDVQVSSTRVGEILDLVVETDLGVEGSFQGDLTAGGTWDDLQDLRERLELSELVLTREGHRIHNLQPVVAELGAEALDVKSLFLGDEATGSELFLAGTVGLGPGDYPLDLHLQTSLDAAWFGPLFPELQVQGVFDALATVRGTLIEPRVNGQGEVRSGRALLPGFPHSLDDVSAIVFFYPQEVVLQQMTGRLASGRVRLTGRMEMPRADEPLDYELQATARDLALRYPEGWTLRGGGELILRAPADGGGRELAGSLRLDRAFYVQDVPIGLFQVLQAALRRQRLALQETEEVLATTHLSLAIQGDGALRVRNNVADLSGDVSLSLQGTLARPVLFGQVEVEPGGRLEFRDEEYKVERGLVTFSNPYEIEPVIDLVASSEVRQYDVRLMLSGTLDRLNASFSSDPPLADLEILGLLTTGSTPDGQAGQQQTAERFLFGQAASAISRRVNALFGFDEFRINPGTGTELGREVGVTVEKRLSRDLKVVYTRDPGTTETEVVQIAWEVAEGVTLILTREGDESFALDARWERSF